MCSTNMFYQFIVGVGHSPQLVRAFNSLTKALRTLIGEKLTFWNC